VKNINVAITTGLPSINEIICRRNALLGYIVRLDTSTPAHQALDRVISLICEKSGHRPDVHWRIRAPGRHRNTWIQQIDDGTPTGWRQAWRSAVVVVGRRRNGPLLSTRDDDT